MADAFLDYRLSWSWLLPLLPEDRVFLLGFSAEEQEFWNRVYLNLVNEISQASCCLVKELSRDDALGVDLNHFSSVAVIGTGRQVRSWHGRLVKRFDEVANYALLPPENPRVIVPLESASWIRQGLDLHRPGRRISRVALFAIKCLTFLRCFCPLTTRMLSVASKEGGRMPQGAKAAGFTESDFNGNPRFVLYLGTPDGNRKTVARPLSGQAHIIAKQGRSSEARQSLKQESAALLFLSRTILAPQVPRLEKVVTSDGYLTIHQEYRPRIGSPGRGMDREAIRFLGVLSSLELEARPVEEVLSQSVAASGDTNRKFRDDITLLITEALGHAQKDQRLIWGHRNHGDFAPWNCSWTTQGFFVFDWEESRKWDVALGDAFYWIVGPAIWVQRSFRPPVVEENALEFADSVAQCAKLQIDDMHLYWTLWLLDRIARTGEPARSKYLLLLQRAAHAW